MDPTEQNYRALTRGQVTKTRQGRKDSLSPHEARQTAQVHKNKTNNKTKKLNSYQTQKLT